MTTMQVTVHGPKKRCREDSSHRQLTLARGVDITTSEEAPSPPKKLSHSIEEILRTPIEEILRTPIKEILRTPSEEILRKPTRVGEERREGLGGWSVNRQNEENPNQQVYTGNVCVQLTLTYVTMMGGPLLGSTHSNEAKGLDGKRLMLSQLRESVMCVQLHFCVSSFTVT